MDCSSVTLGFCLCPSCGVQLRRLYLFGYPLHGGWALPQWEKIQISSKCGNAAARCSIDSPSFEDQQFPSVRQSNKRWDNIACFSTCLMKVWTDEKLHIFLAIAIYRRSVSNNDWTREILHQAQLNYRTEDSTTTLHFFLFYLVQIHCITTMKRTI